MKNEQPEIQELSERVVACASFIGNYIGNTEIFANLFGKLYEWAGSKGLITSETLFISSYPNNPKSTPPDELQVDACMSIPDETDAGGDIQKKVLPGGKYTVMHCELTGAQEYELAWEEIAVWVGKSGYEIDISRPAYEVYLNNPEEHPQKHHIVDICLSVK